MLKALLDRVLELSEIRTFKLGDLTFTNATSFSRIRTPEQIPPQTFVINNLKGLMDYTCQLEQYSKGLFFAVKSPTEVSLMSSIDPENDNVQFTFATAIMQMDNYKFNVYQELEFFIIDLLSRFEPNKDRDNVIEKLSHLANEHVIQNTDDKFSQSLQIKTGLTTKANVIVENPITLQPFRTFREVNQPESKFILRYRNKGNTIEAALFEGDGGQWKLDAIKNIKDWLSGNASPIPVIG